MDFISIEHYFEKKEEVENRISSLEKEIQIDEAALTAAEAEYKRLIFAEEDEQADALFAEKQQLAGRIKSKKSRLQTIQEVKDGDLTKLAVEAFRFATEDLHFEYTDQIKEVSAAAEKAKAAYLDSLEDIKRLNLEFNKDLEPYREEFKAYGFGDPGKKHISRTKGMTEEMFQRLSSYGKAGPLVNRYPFFVKSYANGRYVLVEK